MKTPQTDAIVAMRRHDGNHPELWMNEDVIPLIELARKLEWDNSRSERMFQALLYISGSIGVREHEQKIAAKALGHYLEGNECEWKQWEGGQYETSCDNVFEFTHDGIKENGAKFCQYCGKHIKEVPYSEPVPE